LQARNGRRGRGSGFLINKLINNQLILPQIAKHGCERGSDGTTGDSGEAQREGHLTN
jgi:hypothetical protein